MTADTANAKALPIWHPAAPRSAYFRFPLTVAGGATDGWLRCACSGAFQLALDGKRLAGGPVGRLTERPLWWTFPLPLSGAAGDHELTVLAVSEPVDEAPWFLCEGELGPNSPILSGPSWQAKTGPGRSSPFQERHSALEDPRSEARSQVGGPWETAAVVAAEAEPLKCDLPPAIEPEVRPVGLTAHGEVGTTGPIQFLRNPAPMDRCKCVHPDGLIGSGKARTLVGTSDGERAAYLVLDFGRAVAGCLRLRLRADGDGGVIDVGYALSEGEIQERGRYVCADGRQEWSAVHPQVCRYLALRLSQFPSRMELSDISFVSRQVGVAHPPSSSVAATRFEQGVWELGARSLEAVRQEIYITRQGAVPYDWLRALPLALNDYCHTGDTATARTMLATADIEDVATADLPRLLAFPLFAQAYYMYAGDRSTAANALPQIRRILEGASHARTEDGLVRAGQPGGVATTALNALWSGALEAGAWLCGQLGDPDGERGWQRERRQVSRALQAAWSESAYLFADEPGRNGDASFSQWVNGLVLLYGEVSEEQRAGIAAAMHREGVRTPSTLLESFYVADGLWRAGDSGRAVECMKRDWVPAAEHPGGTWCDRSGGVDLAAPGPDYLLASRVLGVRPVAPGYRRLEIRPPQGGAVERASGRLQTGRGVAQLEWWQWEGLTTLEADLEERGETHFAMPRGRSKFPSVSLNGETVWRNEKVHPNPTVREVVAEPGHIVLVVREGGHYRVVVERG